MRVPFQRIQLIDMLACFFPKKKKKRKNNYWKFIIIDRISGNISGNVRKYRIQNEIICLKIGVAPIDKKMRKSRLKRLRI